MATIDATIGGASANSYIALADAETYFEKRLHTTVWDAATDANKDKALMMATRELDNRFDWDGSKDSTTQALAWPRDGVYDDDGNELDDEAIPGELADAVCELALILLSQDTTAISSNAGIKSIKVDVISLEFDKSDRTKPIPKNIRNLVSKWGFYRGGSVVEVARG